MVEYQDIDGLPYMWHNVYIGRSAAILLLEQRKMIDLLRKWSEFSPCVNGRRLTAGPFVFICPKQPQYWLYISWEVHATDSLTLSVEVQPLTPVLSVISLQSLSSPISSVYGYEAGPWDMHVWLQFISWINIVNFVLQCVVKVFISSENF